MRGQPDVGSIQTRCQVEPCRGGWRGRLSIPQKGTQFTAEYPDKDDAIASLVDLRRVAYGPHVSDAALPAIEQVA